MFATDATRIKNSITKYSISDTSLRFLSGEKDNDKKSLRKGNILFGGTTAYRLGEANRIITYLLKLVKSLQNPSL